MYDWRIITPVSEQSVHLSLLRNKTCSIFLFFSILPDTRSGFLLESPCFPLHMKINKKWKKWKKIVFPLHRLEWIDRDNHDQFDRQSFHYVTGAVVIEAAAGRHSFVHTISRIYPYFPRRSKPNKKSTLSECRNLFCAPYATRRRWWKVRIALSHFRFLSVNSVFTRRVSSGSYWDWMAFSDFEGFLISIS